MGNKSERRGREMHLPVPSDFLFRIGNLLSCRDSTLNFMPSRGIAACLCSDSRELGAILPSSRTSVKNINYDLSLGLDVVNMGYEWRETLCS